MGRGDQSSGCKELLITKGTTETHPRLHICKKKMVSIDKEAL